MTIMHIGSDNNNANENVQPTITEITDNDQNQG